MALRAAELRHVRVPVRTTRTLTLTLTLTALASEQQRQQQPLLGSGSSFRSMSSRGHGHVTEEKERVAERALSVVDNFPKADTCKVCPLSSSLSVSRFVFPFNVCSRHENFPAFCLTTTRISLRLF